MSLVFLAWFKYKQICLQCQTKFFKEFSLTIVLTFPLRHTIVFIWETDLPVEVGFFFFFELSLLLLSVRQKTLPELMVERSIIQISKKDETSCNLGMNEVYRFVQCYLIIYLLICKILLKQSVFNPLFECITVHRMEEKIANIWVMITFLFKK